MKMNLDECNIQSGLRNGAQATTTFSSQTPGVYTIKLEVQDDKGKTSSVERTIRVNSAPQIIAECYIDELTPNTILCNASGSSDEDGIASYKWKVENVEYDGVQASIPVTTYGTIFIGLEVSDTLGAKDYTYLSVYVENPDALPLAQFTYSMEMGLEGHFDAQASLAQGRKVSRVVWEFADGVMQESTELTFTRSFQSVGPMNVKLSVFDEQDRSNTLEKSVYIYHVSVPDPGEAGRMTLAGIDSDGDGIRDDVQREIASIASGDIQKTNTLKKATMVFQAMAIRNENADNDIDVIKKSFDIYSCYLFQTNFDANAQKDIGRLKAKVFNTKDRLINSIEAYEGIEGVTFVIPSTIEEFSEKCIE